MSRNKAAGKISSVTRKFISSLRYPREEKILFFSDISELDHVLNMLDGLNEELQIHLEGSVSDEQWKKLITSPVTELIKCLKIACIEFEGFCKPQDWLPEDDEEFLEKINDANQLQDLIRVIDSGRKVKVEVIHKQKNGRIINREFKQQILDEPAYRACAESLRIALKFKQTTGGQDWVDGCIQQLRYSLTRYYAATLDVICRRNKTYVRVGKERLKQVGVFSDAGRKETEKYPAAIKVKWIEKAIKIKSQNPSISIRKLTDEVVKELNIDRKSFESVRKHLSKNKI